jgi:hypothetical protein
LRGQGLGYATRLRKSVEAEEKRLGTREMGSETLLVEGGVRVKPGAACGCESLPLGMGVFPFVSLKSAETYG